MSTLTSSNVQWEQTCRVKQLLIRSGYQYHTFQEVLLQIGCSLFLWIERCPLWLDSIRCALRVHLLVITILKGIRFVCL